MKQVDMKVGDKLIKGCTVSLEREDGVQEIGAYEPEIPIVIHATVSLEEFNNLVARGVIS